MARVCCCVCRTGGECPFRDNRITTFQSRTTIFSRRSKTFSWWSVTFSPQTETFSPWSETFSGGSETFSTWSKTFSPWSETFSPWERIFSARERTFSPLERTFSAWERTFSGSERTFFRSERIFSSPHFSHLSAARCRLSPTTSKRCRLALSVLPSDSQSSWCHPETAGAARANRDVCAACARRRRTSKDLKLRRSCSSSARERGQRRTNAIFVF